MTEEAIFAEAIVKRTLEERTAYLDQVCGVNSELRARMDGLLQAHDHPDRFLDAPVSDVGATIELAPITESAGATIGPYKLREQIGEGGMGVVFVAEQERPVRRKVALKVIKPGMDTKEVIARFEAERQALALMDHPNIAKVLDAGSTATGRPYFVMEFVRGIPITDYCDQNKLTVRDRLELFIQVCRAIQHAHQKGIIHRDVKPSNVLVTLHDGRPVPKVIDFGVAKATNQRLTERTVYTRVAQFIGTPMYMSPEQAERSGLDVDTRSDVYSLGVLLYELLTGTTPFDKERFARAAHAEILRIVKEEEPPKPSTKISTLGENASAISEWRNTDPRKLRNTIRGDLDWTVMKALEKDRTRRYETVSALCSDIQCHLNDQPVQARPPSHYYRLHKTIKRNKLLACATGIVATGLIVGCLGLAIGYWQSQIALGKAIAAEKLMLEQTRRLQRQKYMSDMVTAANELKGNNVRRVMQLLQQYVPADGATDLRGFEWYLLSRKCRQNTSDETFPLSYGARSPAYSLPKNLLAIGLANNSVALFHRADRRIQTIKREGPLWSPVYVALSRDGETLVLPDEVTTNIKVLNLSSNRSRILNWEHVVSSVSLSGDNRTLASGDMAGNVVVWNLDSGSQRCPHVRAHPNEVYAVALSPDGSILATCSPKDSRVKLWETSNLALKVEHDRHAFGAEAVAFSPDGATLASGGSDGLIVLWDLQSARCRASMRGHSDALRSLVFSPDGRRLLSGSRDGTVRLWDTAKGTAILEKKISSAGWATFLDEETVASVSFDGMLRLWKLKSAESLSELKLNDVCIDVAFATDSEFLFAVQHSPRKVVRCELKSRRVVEELGDENVRVVDVASDGTLAMGGDDGVITLRRPDGTSSRRRAHGGPIWQIAFSPDSKKLASLGLDNRIKIWGLASEKPLQDFLCGSPNVRSYDCGPLAFSPDGTLVASADAGNNVMLFNVTTGEPIPRRVTQHKTTVLAVAFSPDGKTLASCSWDGTVQLSSVAGPGDAMPPSILSHPLWVKTLTFTADGSSLVTSCGDHKLRFWDVGEKQLRCAIDAPGVESMELSPNGLILAGGTYSGVISIWERD